MRNPVYLEIEFTVFILFDGADGMSGIKTSVKLGRIEFTFYPDLLELAQSCSRRKLITGISFSTYGK